MRKRYKAKLALNKAKKKFNKTLDWSVPMLIGGGISLLLCTTFAEGSEINPHNNQCKFLEELSPYQYNIAYQSYKAGKPYDLGLTSVAIAWEESKLGLYKVRWGDGIDKSFGVGHTLAYYKTKDVPAFEAGRWVQSMIENDAKSIDIMVQDILYWQNRSKGDGNGLDWFVGVGMYNGGNTPNISYAKNVANTVRRLKNCDFD